MAFTENDLNETERAIVKFASGAQQQAITIGDKVEQYAIARLPELIALRDRIKLELNAANTDATKRRPMAVVTRYDSGL